MTQCERRMSSGLGLFFSMSSTVLRPKCMPIFKQLIQEKAVVHVQGRQRWQSKIENRGCSIDFLHLATSVCEVSVSPMLNTMY